MHRIRHFIAPLSGLVCLGIVIAVLFTLNNPVSWDDGLRHFVMARTMMSEGLGTTWQHFLYEGYFGAHSVDPWFLSDVFYMPFTFLETVPALKMFTVCSIALLLLAMWMYLRKLALPTYFTGVFLTLLLFGDRLFFLRTLLGRPYLVMTAVVITLLHLLKRKHWLLISVLLCVATLLSHLFIFPVAIAGVYFVWFVLQRHTRDALHCAASVIVGVGVGLILHPQTTEYVRYMSVFFRIPFLTDLNLGSEMRIGIPFVITAAAALLIAFFLLTVARKWNPVEMNTQHLLAHPIAPLSFLALGFLGCTAFWIRGIDFLWPIVLLLLAETYALTRMSLNFEHSAKRLRKHILALIIALVALCTITILRVSYDIHTADSRHTFPSGAIMEAVPAGAHVLNLHWDSFPILLTLRSDVQYATAMDPSLTHVTDPEVQALLQMYSSPAFRLKNPIIDVDAWLKQVLERYPADYIVLSPKRFHNLLPKFRELSSLKELPGADENFVLFQVVN